MSKKVLLITPPFVQLNTPYPATAYLKGFFNTIGVESFQVDLGIEVILEIFSRKGLREVFNRIEDRYDSLSENARRIFDLREDYLACIEPVIDFLQHKNPTLALSVADRSFLPEAGRFAETDELDWAFGSMGTHDKARHLATLFLEDIGDLIREAIDEHFGFSRYAERLGRTMTHFAPLETELEKEDTFVTSILLKLLEEKVKLTNPRLVLITIPFPGNVFSAFKIGQYLKKHYSGIQVAIGGGYCNTELRRLRRQSR